MDALKSDPISLLYIQPGAIGVGIFRGALKGMVKGIPVMLSVIHGLQLAVQVFFGNKTEEDIKINPAAFTVINDRPLRELLIEELKGHLEKYEFVEAKRP